MESSGEPESRAELQSASIAGLTPALLDDPDQIVADARVALMRLEAIEAANRNTMKLRFQAVIVLTTIAGVSLISLLLYIRFYALASGTYLVIASTATASIFAVSI